MYASIYLSTSLSLSLSLSLYSFTFFFFFLSFFLSFFLIVSFFLQLLLSHFSYFLFVDNIFFNYISFSDYLSRCLFFFSISLRITISSHTFFFKSIKFSTLTRFFSDFSRFYRPLKCFLLSHFFNTFILISFPCSLLHISPLITGRCLSIFYAPFFICIPSQFATFPLSKYYEAIPVSIYLSIYLSIYMHIYLSLSVCLEINSVCAYLSNSTKVPCPNRHPNLMSSLYRPTPISTEILPPNFPFFHL
ncbi:unnamed protein product [Acanthosepion pharaonis]|uniref:Uncharacterized protein n=1 Tax=Acanthosepion pharaonis TaxID=158019 RepID=A0A812CWQ6_ACAPH|nr:unnamed protein product [Sepia pharaonis]